VIVLAAVAPLVQQPVNAALSQAAARPNILLIVSDDQRADTMAYMPLTKKRIFDQGVAFSNGFVTTSVCCPSRSSILTGMYAHQHGVHDNNISLTKTTIAERLHANGYYTGLIGKYLNSWRYQSRPEFDYWVAGYGYHDPVLTVNGQRAVQPGYSTYILRDHALDFFDRADAEKKPFFLIWTPTAPHAPATPAPGDETRYPDLPLHRPPSYNEVDTSDKPVWLQQRASLTKSEMERIDTLRRKMLQSLASLDRSVDSLLTRLEEQGKLDNTLVVYLSDNGFYWGEHRLSTKGSLYEEAIKVPFALRYPPLARTPRVEPRLVANIDIAPTVLELAGIAVPPEVDGRSLVPLLKGTSTWRQELLVETWNQGLQVGLRTPRYLYVQSQWDKPELYDLQVDPFQLDNKASMTSYAAIVNELSGRLSELYSGNRMVAEDTAVGLTYGGWRRVSNLQASGGGYVRSSQPDQPLVHATLKPATSVRLVTYRGPDQGLAQVSIDGKVVETLDLYAPKAEWQYVRAFNGLSLRKHKLTIQPLGRANYRSRGTEVRVDAIQTGFTVEDNHPSMQYDSWKGWIHSTGSGGSVRRSQAAGATVSFSFTGTEFTWLTARGPSAGRAQVTVDGKVVATIDLYKKTKEMQYRQVFDGFKSATHVVQIKVLGKANPRSNGNEVLFDAVQARNLAYASSEVASTSRQNVTSPIQCR
jgi:N-acetylglucosamine-6-sulfatase